MTIIKYETRVRLFAALRGHALRSNDVAFLRGLITAAQQHDHLTVFIDEIHTVAWTKINLHLGNAFANRLELTRIAKFHAIQASQNPNFALTILEAVEPDAEGFRFDDLYYVLTIVHTV